ncbi:MAG: N-6 DNA methylase, partial [Synergistaceae bacterium]|nr:N-6 DNA methylase [Synergistaceae bacterium]
DLFNLKTKNDRETVLHNTYKLNELLHKMGINENERSQFVGTTLLYIKDLINKTGAKEINQELLDRLKNVWSIMSSDGIRAEIGGVLRQLLDNDNDNKAEKLKLLQKAVLDDQKVKQLDIDSWIKILESILTGIYKYIDFESSEGQDILNLFFTAFNKYVRYKDKNQAFTPDHITDLMCRAVGVDRSKVVMDICCGSGSFLVQAMVKELADCRRNKADSEAEALMAQIKKKHIYGIELEEQAYGLSTTNMLIHGDGNSNIKFGSCFDNKNFIKDANPDIFLMNPPYNAIPKDIPGQYKKNWGSAKNGHEDPTKGFVFVHFLSDVIKEMNDERERNGQSIKTVKLAVLLPVSAAIGNSSAIKSEKQYMLEHNTLEAVFTLPNEVFYPGASVSACCMIFTLGKPHVNSDGTVNKTFFGYFKEDGFKKKKNLGRVEQFDENKNSKWKPIMEHWLKLFRDKQAVDSISAVTEVTADDEWLCEAYMTTDYSKLSNTDFQNTVKNYLAYLVKTGKVYEPNTNEPSTPPDLNTQSWKEFRVGDFFDVELSKGDIKADEIDEGDVLLISSGCENNGVIKRIDGVGDGKAEIFSGNKITVDMFGNAYYQAEPFYAVSHGRVNILTAKFDLNKYIALFIATLINGEQFKYSYGRAVYSNVVTNMTLKLPAAKTGKPDWQFMENYIKSLHHKPITTRNNPDMAPALNVKDWKEFKVGDILDCSSTSLSIKDDLPDGNVPFISRTVENNGVDGYVDITPDKLTDGNCLTIGAEGIYAFYQPDAFATGNKIYQMRRNNMNQYIGLFLATVLNLEDYKYSYGRARIMSKLQNENLKLPSDANGEPDWQFMENYIKALPYGDRI